MWHDYEAWGADPHKDHPCQFAAIRTDEDLNPIGKPIDWMCQIPNDYLPHPMACLITGITPQQSLHYGMLEYEFMNKVQAEMSIPGTCSVGYNSIRYDDELTRFSLYRNFHDPYAREWQQGNSRWDIIDLVRATYALRPEGIEWVYDEAGSPRFKLELLSQANDIEHLSAHDALSDVRATIGLAKKIKEAQPKLFHFVLSLRNKHAVNQQLRLGDGVPVVHISSKFPATHGCCSWVLPIVQHPVNKNAVIAIDLQHSPESILDNTAEDVRQLLYTRQDELPKGVNRPPIKQIHSNKCPVVAPAKTLDEQNAERLGIDREACLRHLDTAKQHFGALRDKLIDVHSEQSQNDQDADSALYSGGFISNADRKLCQQLLEDKPDNLSNYAARFSDTRLKTLLFRYRARNFPHTLSDEEVQKWQRHRYYKLHDASSPASIKLDEFALQLEHLSQEYQNDAKKVAILKNLYQYAEQL
ncbi:MAG: exodeoxyribonuclease I [Aestuariibacter sp.]